MSEQPVSRGEFIMLAAQVAANTQRVEGIGVLQLQVTDLAKDFAKHEAQHEIAETRRVSGRRWLIATIVAGAGAFGGLYALILDMTTRLH